MLRSNSVSAQFLFLIGGVFCLAGLLLMVTGDPFLIAFPIGVGIVNILTGFWYRRVGRPDQ